MRTITKTAVLAMLILFVQAARAQCGVNAGSGASICTAGGSITLTATATSGSPDTFTWTSNPASVLPATKSITVSPTVTTTYYVQATGNGCDAIDSVVVKVGTPPPTPSFTFTPSGQCTGIPITFSTTQQAGNSYGWSFGDGSTASGATATYAYQAYGTGTGTYTVTLTDTNAAGCTSSATQNVSVIKGPAPTLGAGPGVDTLTFDGNMTFYVCAAAAQQNLDFSFVNQAPTGPNITYKILWGDTGAPFVSDTAWTLVNHTYGRSIYYLSYIVTNTATGCSDTGVYKVFYGSNPSGGIASPGNTDICGPGVLTFVLSNFQNNTPGTIYTISFNDSSAPIVYKNTPPDTITHLFNKSSCGVSSSNGITTYNNSFAVSLTVQNPCGITSGSVLPIYVSLPPVANYTPPGTACTGTTQLYTNTTTGGLAASSSGCNNNAPILWNLTPSTGWTLTTGSFGSDNGYTGTSFDPALWTAGSNTIGISYTTPGTYTMRLVAANSCGPDTIIKKFCVAAPPPTTFSVAGLTGSNGCAPDTVTLTNTTFDTSTCSVPTYNWAVTKVSAVCTPNLANDYQYINHTDSLSDTTKLVFNNQGSYTVTLNATNVCGTYPATKTVNIATPPQVSMSIPAAVCVGTLITPTSTAEACGGTVSGYAWSFPGGTPSSSTNQNPGTVSLGSAGNYTISLDVTNNCGSASASQNITVSSYPVANPGANQQMCSGSSVTIGSAPVAGLTYSWLPVTGLSSASASNPTLTLTNNGTAPVAYTYHLTVTNAANCSTTDSVVITVYPAAWVNAGPAINVCTGQSVTLGGTFGGAATSVTWTSSGGGTFSDSTSATSIYTPPASGTVTLTLTSNTPTGPCPAATGTTTVTVVTPPVAVTGPDTTICSGTTIKIGGNNHAGYTYTWSPATGLSNIHSSKPTVTLTNTGSNPITQTYQLIVSATGCADTASVTVTVYPQPGASAGPNLSVCTGGSVTLNGSISGSATSAVWSSSSGTFGNPNSLTTTFTPSITSGIATVTLTTAQAAGGCAPAIANASVTVNAIPTVTNTPLLQDACSGAATQAVNLTASVGGSTFSWSGSSTDGASGFIASGTTSTIPAQTLINSSTTAESVVYVITPSANGCTGPSANYSITIEPQPNISAIAPQTICSGSVTTAVTPVSSVAGSSFNWTATAGASLSGYFASGTGNIPAQTILNSGNKMDSVVYSITATANSCGGPVTKFVVHVNPQPAVTVPAAQTICSGATTTAVNLSSNVAGATFSWTANASAGITGFTASGTGNIPAETLKNTSTTAGTVIYNILASAAGCTGAAQAYTVTVNPVPTATATPSSPSVCSGTDVNIALSSSISGTTFSWTEQSAAGISGASNGSGNTIGQTLSNSGTATGKVSYYITASANSCAGPVDTEVVSVYPVANVQFSTVSQNICSGQATQVVKLSSLSAGATFSWTSQANGINGVLASGTDSIPAQVLTNNTSNALTADYNVTASFAGCTGQSGTYPVTVSAQPSVTLPAPQTICSGASSTAVTLSSSIPGTTFAWAIASNSNVTGDIVSGTGANIPAQTLTDTSSAQGSITYAVTPSLSGCAGTPADYTITVNSSLTITPVSPQGMCSGTTSNGVTLSSNFQNTTFNWTATAGAFISGFTSQGTGNIPGQTITNSGNATDSIVYTITANASGCTGNPAVYVLTVNPIPQVITPAQQTICSGTQTSAVILTSNVTGTSFNWTASSSPYITGYQNSGTGNIPAQTIYNSGYNDDSVVYGITPVYGNCQGQSRYFAIVVHPGAHVVVNAASNSICSGMQTNITLSSPNPGETFTWTVIQPAGVSGATAGSGNTIDQLLTTSSQTAQTVSYIITAGGSGCPGLPDTFNITVNPGIDVQVSTGPQTLCSGQSTQAVSLSSNQSGVSFSWFAQSNGISGVISSGSNVIPVQTLYNQSNQPDSVNYIITATSGSCPGQTSNYSVHVNPLPQLNTLAPQTICSGATTAAIDISSDISGTNFAWSGTGTNVTGYMTTGTGGTIPAQTLGNTSSSSGTVNYTITPSANGCTGPVVSCSIIVNPEPILNPLSLQTICSGSTSNAVSLSANVSGTTFSWTGTGGSYLSGYSTQGSGNIPAQTIANNGNAGDSVVYTINGTANGCPANPIRMAIVVNPIPQITAPADQTLCNGGTSTAVTLSSTVSGTTFSWAASAPANLSGYSTSGSGNIPAQTIRNSGTGDDSVVYTITPSANGCQGASKEFAMVVHPTNYITAIPLAASVCSGTVVGISIASKLGGGSFNWTAQAPAGVSGAVSGSGNTISQMLTSTSTNNETVTYIISETGAVCPAVPDTTSVTITPGISIQFSVGPQTVCSGQSTQAVTLSSPGFGVNFAWTSQANGVSGAASSGSNVIPVQTLYNMGSQAASVDYLITATSAACPSQTATYVAQVNPLPQMNAPAPQTICSGAVTAAINLSSNITGTSFAWTGTGSNVSGYTANGSGATIPAQTLNNTSSVEGTVTYTITPTANGCTGPVVSSGIIINPEPIINPAGSQVICSGSTSNAVSLSANVSGTTFNWTGTGGTYLSGYSTQGSGNIPVQTISNNGNEGDSVVYTINGTANGCPANPIRMAIVVNPIPQITAPADQTLCNGGNSTAVTLSSNVNGTTFSWVASAPANLSGYSTSGSGNIPAQTLRNSGTGDDSVVYTITSSANGCQGASKEFAMVVHPTNHITATPSANSVCSGTTVNIALASNLSGGSFNWTATAPAGVTGAASGSGNNISQTISSTSTNNETVTYIISETGAVCPTVPDTTSVTITPGISIQFSVGPQTVCSGQSTQAVTLSSPGYGVNFSWTSQANGVTGAASSGSNVIPVQTLYNPGSQAASVDYLITATSATCPSQTATYVAQVNPLPQVNLPAPQNICSGNGTSQVDFTSNVAGASFTWTATADSVTGYVASGTGSSIPAQTLSNNFSAPGTVNYTIVPSANGCAAAPVNYTIHVNPAVVISPVSPQLMCSGSQSAYVKPAANVDNISFEWNATGGPYLEGYMAQGTGDIPPQTVLNTGNVPDSVIYTISSNAGGCPGNTEKFTLTVNPQTQAIVPGDQLMCSGSQSTEVDLTATVNGTTFTWTASASYFMTGYDTSGAGDIPSQTIYNSGNYEDSVNYTITPMAYGCAGPNKAYAIKVRPNAKSVSVPGAMTICSGTQTSMALSSSILGATFLWVVNEPAGVTGAFSGYGDTISQTLYNSGSNPATVIYVISPEGVACPGKPDSIDVIVTPGINIQLSASPQNICSGQNTQAVNLSSTSNGVSFSWVSQANGVSGASAYGSNIIPVQTLVNSNLQTDSVYYMVTATSAVCPAQTASYTVAVKPNPQLNLPAPQAVCSGTEASAIHFSSALGGTEYSWTGSASNGITGVIPGGNTDSVPAMTVMNSTFDTGAITYTITATSNGCSSPGANYKVLVYPTPDINVPASQEVCTGAQTAPVAFTSHVSGTVFNWAVSVDSNVTGATLSGTGNIPAQTLDNTAGTQGVITYTVTPYTGNCKGVSANYSDTVYPTPIVNAPAPQTVCSGEWTGAVTLTSPTPGASITWTASIPAGISGATASGGNTIASQRLYNNLVDTFPQPLTINYTLSASVQGSVCPARNSTYSITVLPHPQASFISSVSSGCSPLTVAFEPKTMNYGQPDSLIFMWGDGTPNTVVYPSQAYPEWYSVNHTFYNTSSSAVTYNVLMRASNGCWDTLVSRPITIMPNAINAFFTTSPATGCAPLTVKFQDQSQGASLLSWCFNYNLAKDSCMGLGVVDSAGSSLSETFNAGTYTIALYTVSQYGCAHDTAYQTIVVNPSPVAAFTVPATTCAQNDFSFTNQSTPATGSFIAQYSWQFGDGDSSLNEQASHTYALPGNYTVCLTVTSSSGCSNSICQQVGVGSRPSVNFSVQNACVNQQTGYFTNLSSGAAQYYWLFGDGGASTAPAPSHVYLSAGSYTVTLVGSNTGGCNDTASHSVNIFPAPHAGFTTPPVPGCGLPAEMELTNTSTGAIAYEWNLGNGATSQFDNPDAIYTATGTFTITLVASNSNNCFDTATGQVTIYPKPVVTANVNAATGCQPLPVLFHANSTNANTYVWNFGDGSSETTTVPYAEHSYPDTGYYPVILMVYSQGTCGDTITLPDSVIVHPVPTAGFQYFVTDSDQLNNGTIQFMNTSTNANIYNWYFGDGASSQDVNPSHMFPDVDQFEVMLIATNSYGCSDTALESLDVVKKSLYVPNAFAPEYSGPNTLVQVWKPAGIGLRTYKAEIFDKWGELLWQSTALTPELEPAEGWDGTYQGKLCQQGVYVWKIEATFVDGTIWTGTAVGKDKVAKTIGSVTLIR